MGKAQNNTAKRPVKKAQKPKGLTVGAQPKKLSKRSLAGALMAKLKADSGRSDLNFTSAPEFATKTVKAVSIEDRAGFPLVLRKSAVHPSNWRTATGVRVEVDFGRAKWLPDDWGQGIKATVPTFRSTGGGGGTLITFVAPDGKTMFFHKKTSQLHAGKELTEKDGFNGQVRLAKLQAQQIVQAARAQIKEYGSTSSYIGADSDASFFKLLSARERKVLPSADEFHFCVVSARRATKSEGVIDIFTVETQFKEAGVTPTWYVDAESVKDYQALGLKAVVGGKLTEARNKALDDAAKKGKICVQISDDISAWEYREGPKTKERSDDAQNKAWKNAERYIVSPVAAARFILAKMRGVPEGEPQPQLGGVYMLGSCSRTFAGDPFVRHHFIIGDFFVADKKSKVRFDQTMKLKEDYDFTCGHLKAHGSVMRCQRMTLNVKHYANSGGACTNRDGKGEEERRNVAILKTKWPGVFRDNPKRPNEVIMKWRDQDDDDETGDATTAAKANVQKTSVKTKAMSKKVSGKKVVKKSFPGLKPLPQL